MIIGCYQYLGEKMRYLTKEYWKLFEKTDGNRKDGKKFEELIQILLNSLYSDKKIVSLIIIPC